MNRTRSRRSGSGFGLLELMIAIAVATVVLVSVGVSQSVCFNLNRTSQETIAAAADLESAMEAVLLLPPDEIVDANGPYAAGQPILAFESLHLENERIVAEYPGWAGGDVPDPLPIRLTITFDDYAGRERSMSIATLRTR